MNEQHSELSICMLVTNLDAPTGGVQKNSRLLLSELDRRGIKTFVCARNYYDLAKNETVGGTVYHRSPVIGKTRGVNGALYLIDAFVWLIRNRKRFDVLHCQQMFGPTMVATVASYLLHKPILTRVTTCGELGEVKHIREMPFSGIRMRLIRRVTQWVALTTEMKDELETLDILPDKIEIVPNSTEIRETAAYDDPARASLRQKLGFENDEKVAVFVGRLSEEKNLDVLIDAWTSMVKRFPGSRLILLGAGGEYRNVEAELREQVASLGLERSIIFAGHVSNVKEYVISSDVFVLPSRTEGMSNALVEALGCGAAVVVTDISANREICTNGENALLVPVGSADALAEAMNLIFDDPGLARELGNNARNRAERELSVETMVSSYIRLYRKMGAASRS